MSKTLFLVSRCLLVVDARSPRDKETLLGAYLEKRRELGARAPEDDFDFAAVLSEVGDHIEYILDHLVQVRRIVGTRDALGLVFDSLLRGKFEGGEGLGTFLTPEEVTGPMVSMIMTTVGHDRIRNLFSSSRSGLLFGDPCGGTGRFVYTFAKRMRSFGISARNIQGSARLFDQSRMAVDFARLNFLFDGLTCDFLRVDDSLTSDHVSALKGRFLLLATNPPFGSGKYRWSKHLAHAMPYEVLAALEMSGPGATIDPSELFLFRNLDLLANGGTLGIVLPDGVLHSQRLKSALRAYQQLSEAPLAIDAIVSLPAATFALGGTVAKTSFVIFSKGRPSTERRTYVAVVQHVGFTKRGNRRALDPAGNDLDGIVRDFVEAKSHHGSWVDVNLESTRLSASELLHSSSADTSVERRRLGTLAGIVNERTLPTASANCFHISILDVDETGYIDVITASRNQPVTPGFACAPGDILVSCLNPNIWRVAVVPNLGDQWTCSAEFLVLRPVDRGTSWRLALSLHAPDIIASVRALAGGTSSSRQRVPKQRVLDVEVPVLTVPEDVVEAFSTRRTETYRVRLHEAGVFEALHSAEVPFWHGVPSSGQAFLQTPSSRTSGRKRAHS